MTAHRENFTKPGSRLLVWTAASLAIAAVAVGVAVSLGASASAMARQRDAARASIDRLERDARRDHNGAIATRTLIDTALENLTKAHQRSADALAREQTTRSARDEAIRQRDQAREQLAVLRAQSTEDAIAAAKRIEALRASIDAAQEQITTLDVAHGRAALDHAAALIALAEAELALDQPTAAHEHAHAALLLVDAQDAHADPSPLVLRAQRVQSIALVKVPSPSVEEAARAMELASELLDRVDAESGRDSDERWQIASMLGQATLAGGDPSRAVTMLTEVLAVQLDRDGLASAPTRLTQVRLAEALIAGGRRAEGSALLHLVLKAERDAAATPVARRAQAALDTIASPDDEPNSATRLASQDSDDSPD